MNGLPRAVQTAVFQKDGLVGTLTVAHLSSVEATAARELHILAGVNVCFNALVARADIVLTLCC